MAIRHHHDLVDHTTKSLKELIKDPDANIIQRKLDLTKSSILNFLSRTKVECESEIKQQIGQLKDELRKIDKGERQESSLEVQRRNYDLGCDFSLSLVDIIDVTYHQSRQWSFD